VKLEQNYRSDQTILDAAHAVISHNSKRMDKKLWSQRPRGEALGLLINRDERGEAQEIARRIGELVREGFVEHQQIASSFGSTRRAACWKRRCAWPASPTRW